MEIMDIKFRINFDHGKCSKYDLESKDSVLLFVCQVKPSTYWCSITSSYIISIY